jgi:hypothetical protein
VTVKEVTWKSSDVDWKTDLGGKRVVAPHTHTDQSGTNFVQTVISYQVLSNSQH